jgi:hypothetical protein
MNDYVGQVVGVIRAITFRSPTTYSWFGSRSPQLVPAVRRALSSKSARDYLLYSLQSQLYRDFYCRGTATLSRNEASRHYLTGLTPFVQRLSEANVGHGYWKEGYEVRTIEDGALIVRAREMEIWTKSDDCLVPEGSPIEPGMPVSVRFPKEMLSISPGYYMALGNNTLTGADSQNQVRFYWNLNADGALHLVKSLTSRLNSACVPFRLKVVNDTNRFDRCDAAVLYVSESNYDAAARIVSDTYSELASNLKPGVPAFTKKLAPGLGLAEDPGDGQSFGQHRCKLLAQSLVRGHEEGKRSIDARLQVVIDQFSEAGIDLFRPYLNQGSDDDYTLISRWPHPGASTLNSKQLRIVGEGSFLHTATQIGKRLLREAVWYDGRCNWVGAKSPGVNHRNGYYSLTYSALGPTLYDGTSGVALFLAELYAISGGDEVRRTALGAIRQALSHVEDLPPERREGLYTGWLGIALAAVRVGVLLGETEVVASARDLATNYAHNYHTKHEYDLISGTAGTIVACLVLQKALGDPVFLNYAVRVADELIVAADRSDAGYSWKSVGFRTLRNLTGFSHGAAGIGHALLELASAAGDERYRIAAELAFKYERYWFDPAQGNWPDFRKRPGQSRPDKPALQGTPCMVYWCHGAPGIALARLRAYQLLGDRTYIDEAIAALETTRKSVEIALRSGLGDFSLCHGLAGNAEVLLYGHKVLGQEWVAPNKAIELGEAGIQNYAQTGKSWPCGVGAGYTPSLMLGLAGIGHFYLRLHTPSIPSALLLPGQ